MTLDEGTGLVDPAAIAAMTQYLEPKATTKTTGVASKNRSVSKKKKKQKGGNGEDILPIPLPPNLRAENLQDLRRRTPPYRRANRCRLILGFHLCLVPQHREVLEAWVLL